VSKTCSNFLEIKTPLDVICRRSIRHNGHSLDSQEKDIVGSNNRERRAFCLRRVQKVLQSPIRLLPTRAVALGRQHLSNLQHCVRQQGHSQRAHGQTLWHLSVRRVQ
jgi:hypothetical protein